MPSLNIHQCEGKRSIYPQTDKKLEYFVPVSHCGMRMFVRNPMFINKHGQFFMLRPLNLLLSSDIAIYANHVSQILFIHTTTIFQLFDSHPLFTEHTKPTINISIAMAVDLQEPGLKGQTEEVKRESGNTKTQTNGSKFRIKKMEEGETEKNQSNVNNLTIPIPFSVCSNKSRI